MRAKCPGGEGFFSAGRGRFGLRRLPYPGGFGLPDAPGGLAEGDYFPARAGDKLRFAARRFFPGLAKNKSRFYQAPFGD